MTGNMASDGNDWMRSQGREDVWVRVWFDTTCVAHYRADRELAQRYVADVRSHFHGLTFTIDPLPDDAPPTRPLPAEKLWTVVAP
jgi:hypothetical protein